MTGPDYALIEHDGGEWEGCEPGWYWGTLEVDEYGHASLGDSVGPFPTAGEAALDMARSMVEGSVMRRQAGGTN